MDNNYCKRMCNECPFSKNSPQGFLPGYEVSDFYNMMQNDVFFPCHMMMPDRDLSLYETSEMVKRGELKICRGYLEAMVKSCILPKHPLLIKMRKAVKAEGLSDLSMSNHEFRKHHQNFFSE